MKFSGIPRHLFPALLATLLLLATGPATATLYKWTDANGRVVYSDQPPAGNIKSEIMQGPPPPANPAAVKDLTKQETEFKKRQLDAAESAKKSDTLRADQVKRNEACTRALAQARMLAATEVPIMRRNDKGEDVFMDDATRRRERMEVDIWVKGNCTAG
jgi:hypothetical protein